MSEIWQKHGKRLLVFSHLVQFSQGSLPEGKALLCRHCFHLQQLLHVLQVSLRTNDALAQTERRTEDQRSDLKLLDQLVLLHGSEELQVAGGQLVALHALQHGVI